MKRLKKRPWCLDQEGAFRASGEERDLREIQVGTSHCFTQHHGRKSTLNFNLQALSNPKTHAARLATPSSVFGGDDMLHREEPSSESSRVQAMQCFCDLAAQEILEETRTAFFVSRPLGPREPNTPEFRNRPSTHYMNPPPLTSDRSSL